MSDNTTIIIFGATGDLAKKYLWPSIESLTSQDLITKPDIIGVAHRDRTQAEFSDLVHKSTNQSDWWRSISYISGELTGISVYEDIQEELSNKDPHVIIAVFAIAPEYFSNAVTGMNQSGLIDYCRSNGHELRILIEKPFGTDLESAKKLDELLCSQFSSEEIYRIDHYQGKSMLQNLYTLRFANQWLDAGWNHHHISRVEALFVEQVDVLDRGAFYDKIGAWRDVGQNHLLQLLSAGMMNHPKTSSTKDFHLARTEFIESLEIVTPELWQRKQYETYKTTRGVSSDSDTETYFEILLKSNLENWQGVPIKITAGKSTSKRETSINFYTCPKHYEEKLPETKLSFVATPHESASIELWGQDSSHADELEKHEFKFSYQAPKTNAYERVFYGAINGEQKWFTSSSEIMAQWKISDEVHQKLRDIPMEIYPDNTLLN